MLLALSCSGGVAQVTDVISIETAQGNIKVELHGKDCPQNVAAFKAFVRKQVYTGSAFHTRGPDYIFGGKPGPHAVKAMGESGNFSAQKAPPGEFTLEHRRGALIVARTAGSCNPDKRTNSTQFTISLEDSPTTSREYTAIGYVVEGMEAVDKIAAILNDSKAKAADTRIKRIKVLSK